MFDDKNYKPKINFKSKISEPKKPTPVNQRLCQVRQWCLLMKSKKNIMFKTRKIENSKLNIDKINSMDWSHC